MVTVLLSPEMMRPVTLTSLAEIPDGNTKKSSVLVADPFGVATVILPEPPKDGTEVEILVEVAELTEA